MLAPDEDPGDNGVFWFNLLGIVLAAALLGAFVLFYGQDLLSFWTLLTGGGVWPGH